MAPKKTFQNLVELMAQLRGSDGCPWDREQTYATLGPMLVEEVYEVLEAAEAKDWLELRNELGDLLFQIIFYAQIATEERHFDIYDAITSVHEKMTRRHPHVFGEDKVKVNSIAEVLANWETIKAAERRAEGKTTESKQSLLNGVSAKLPALLEAYQLTTKAARVGFDWERIEDVFAKMDEEVRELRFEIDRQPRDASTLAAEIGDLLFVLVNLARQLAVEPEIALKMANRKFRRRFAYIEEQLAIRGKTCTEATLAEMDALWDEAKLRERQSPLNPAAT